MAGLDVDTDRPANHRLLSVWILGLLLAGFVSMPVVAETWADAPSVNQQPQQQATAFDCAKLKDQAMPDSAEQWFERSLWANHCYVFKARAVRMGNDGIRTLTISHDIKNGMERDVARLLDGPPVVFERRGRIGLDGWSGDNANPIALPSAILRNLNGHYRLSLNGEERIAGRSTLRLDIEPLDNMRYGHRLWLDKQTALPLKRMLINERGQMLETFQVTDLKTSELHGGEVILDKQRVPPKDSWQLSWLPPGYQPLPMAARRSMHNTTVEQRLFSDGLSDISLFVEPIQEKKFMLAQGLHRLGISYAAVRHIDIDGDPMQIIALGELPPKVLLKVIDNIIWQTESGDNEN